MIKIKKISVELAVFLMIALVAFGGFASLSVDDGSGNGLTGDWKKPKWVKSVQRAVSKPVEQVKAEIQRVENKATLGMIKAASAPIRHPEQTVKTAEDIKKTTNIMIGIAGVASGIGAVAPSKTPDDPQLGDPGMPSPVESIPGTRTDYFGTRNMVPIKIRNSDGTPYNGGR